MPPAAAALLALLPWAVAGYLAARWAWPEALPSRWQALVRAGLGVGLAVGASSGGYLTWAAAFGPTAPGLGAVEAVAATLLAAALLVAARRPGVALPAAPPEPALPLLRRILTAVLAVAALVAAVAVVFQFAREPHGPNDAWAVWNLRARFLFRGGDRWADGFSPLLAYSHPDYPPLLPASIARGWRAAGADALSVPQLIASLYLTATAALLTGGLAILRSPAQACLAGILLLAAPDFVRLAAGQYADVPLGCYFLAVAVLFAAHDRAGGSGRRLPLLAGFVAGMAACTKNEGLLYVAATGAARAAVARRGALREAPAFLAGLAVPAAALAYFKLRYAPANDLFVGQGREATLTRFADAGRYLQILSAFGKEAVTLGGGAALVLAAAWILLGLAPRGSGRPPARHAAAVLALMLVGYFVAYLTSPNDLAWHLATSADRLFLQLWPMTLLAVLLAAATPEERWSLAGARRRAPT